MYSSNLCGKSSSILWKYFSIDLQFENPRNIWKKNVADTTIRMHVVTQVIRITWKFGSTRKETFKTKPCLILCATILNSSSQKSRWKFASLWTVVVPNAELCQLIYYKTLSEVTKTNETIAQRRLNMHTMICIKEIQKGTRRYRRLKQKWKFKRFQSIWTLLMHYMNY